jgi:clan AA aspartic protease (TIGR02281 family)
MNAATFMAAVINGIPFTALVDTGATAVGMNLSDALRAGVSLAGARRINVNTAGGPRQALRVRLASVQVGDLLLRDVEGTISTEKRAANDPVGYELSEPGGNAARRPYPDPDPPALIKYPL